ncbi:MAG: hypothetical protein RMI34_07770 [Chloroherpetonaceae bacterium]|nr:hypothetical protein [Chloroherpetonaceae bacterium]MCS7211826.1 hypothetical protein [Chloroherpetonaceae bacterium]MDW8019957.1 hypothetical protein [Chloroherpetonaceae bacterium]MDW8466824.1 hypothetical protein [Chloroherpetonaceae bacterium]
MKVEEFQQIKQAIERLTPKQRTALMRLLRGANSIRKLQAKRRTNKAKEKLLTELHQSWAEVMRGEYRPIDELLDELREND